MNQHQRRESGQFGVLTSDPLSRGRPLKAQEPTRVRSVSPQIPAVLMLVCCACTGVIGGTPGKGSPAGSPAPGSTAGSPTAPSSPGSATNPTSVGDVLQGTDSTGAACAAGTAPSRAPLRRLTAAQFNNALRDVLNLPSFPVQVLPPETVSSNFLNNADAQTPSAPLIQAYSDAAQAASAIIVANEAAYVPCTESDAGCGAKFAAAFGAKAFRRPLSTDETTRYATLFDQQKSAGSFDIAVRVVAEALLQAPQFLYAPEFGQGTPSKGMLALSSGELASRMALFLTDSPPDTALTAAAQGGALTDAAAIETQARRLLASPAARGAVVNFHRQWLDLARLDNSSLVGKDPQTFPQWGPALIASMKTEVDQFVGSTIFDGDGKLSSLLAGTSTWVDSSLATLYGLPAPSGAGFSQVSLSGTTRSGLLTTSAFLAGHAHQVQSSPVWRGVFVLDELLCTPPNPPPAGVNTAVASMVDTTQTTRQKESAHVTQPSCAGCHKSIDGIGFAFEGFDAIGRQRTTDNGFPVDTTGELVGTDVDGPYDGAAALSQKLASSSQVRACVATQWYRYAFARSPTEQDTCSIHTLDQGFKAANGDVRELLVKIVTSDAFTHLVAP